jgi:photosystem II stability/assembly factor-like uncharacterized protein
VLDEVWFLSPHRAVGIDHACVWSSDDGGGSWQARYCHESPDGAGLAHLWATSDQELWMLADSRLVMHSSDGGVTWRSQELDGVIVLGLAFASARVGWLVGARRVAGVPDARGVVYRTTDSGGTWIEQATGVTMDDRWQVSAVWPRSATEAWVVGDVLLHSVDNGATWRAPSMSARELDRIVLTRRLVSIRFFNAGAGGGFVDAGAGRSDTGWIEQAPDDHGFWVTEDGGRNFHARPLPGPVARGVVFTSPTRAWVLAAGGDHPGVYVSADAGRSWQLSLPHPEPWAAAFYTHLSFVPEQNMLVALGRDHVARCLLKNPDRG